MYTPTEWSTAEDKMKFFKQFVKFVDSDFSPEQFPKWFYKRLSSCFGFITHNDIYGFYDTYFFNTAGRLEFIRKCLEYPCYGDPHWTYSDVEKDIQDYLNSKCVLQRVELAHHNSTRRKEINQLNELAAKHGYKLVER